MDFPFNPPHGTRTYFGIERYALNHSFVHVLSRCDYTDKFDGMNPMTKLVFFILRSNPILPAEVTLEGYGFVHFGFRDSPNNYAYYDHKIAEEDRVLSCF